MFTNSIVTSKGIRREFHAFLLFADEDRQFGHDIRRFLEEQHNLTVSGETAFDGVEL